MITLLVILAIFLQIAISLTAYFKRRSGDVYIIFMLLNLALAAWALTNYIATTTAQNSSSVYSIRTVLSFVVIENVLFYFFAQTFPDKKIRDVKYKYFIILYSLFVIALTQTPFVFASVTIKNGTAIPNPKPAIALFILQALFTIVMALYALYRKYNRAVGQKKNQLRIVLFASTVFWIIVPVTNFGITISAKTAVFAKYSAFYTLFFFGLIAYAIIAEKLFDIRAAVARSVGYVFVLGTLALFYGLILFGVINVLLPGQDHELARQILSIILVAPLVLSFQSLKRFFDKLTNRIFYRDGYDIQTVIDNLGAVIVNEIDLQKILNDTRNVLMNALKPEYMEFVLIRDRKPYLEPHNRWKSKLDAENIGNKIIEQHRELLIQDELATNSDLKDEFDKSQIAVSLRLKTQHQVVGYILFGNKNSGDVYDTKDRNLLLIAANELAITIQNALRFEEIQNFNLTLQYKVEDATHKLREANDRLKELDETKDDFISLASHQLRTPLSIIKGYVKMVSMGDAGKVNEQQKQFLEQALSSSENMVNLVTELLNVSRITSGKFTIDKVSFNLADLVEREVSQLSSLAESKGIKLTYEKPKDFPTVELDEEKIRQVVGNFIDNAIHYSKPKGGTIDVVLTNDDDIEFKVIDNGIGVPHSEKSHLFTKFYRAGNAKAVRPDGTGVGIYLAKVVIDEQKGDLIFDSKEGVGSTFGFKFSKDIIVKNDESKNKVTSNKVKVLK
jgi:signal transduction histidine kinase